MGKDRKKTITLTLTITFFEYKIHKIFYHSHSDKLMEHKDTKTRSNKDLTKTGGKPLCWLQFVTDLLPSFNSLYFIPFCDSWLFGFVAFIRFFAYAFYCMLDIANEEVNLHRWRSKFLTANHVTRT